MSLIYILSSMQSFVKNEVDALQSLGIPVQVVILDNPPKQIPTTGWSYVVGGYNNVIYVPDVGNRFKKCATLLLNIPSITNKYSVKRMIGEFLKPGKRYHSRSLLLYRWRYAVDIFKYISKYKPYRIHTHFAWGNAFVSANVARLLSIPFSLTVHANDIFALTDEDFDALKWLFNECDKVLTISDFNKTYLVSKKLCAENKIHVIHCGVPIQRFEFSSHAYSGGPLKLVTIPSGFVEKKGLITLIRAIQELVRSNIPVECLVIGDDVQGRREKYEREVKASGLSAHVTFIGAIKQSELSKIYESCHAFVLPCIEDAEGKMDGIPVSLMEAMAVGLPVISTHLSGIPELIQHGRHGLLAEPSDFQSLFIQLKELCDNPEHINKMAYAARNRIENQFNITSIAHELIQTLKLNRYV
jgi:colanic acid/amylovoran biosynthesis glycosyltransferase